MQLGGSLLLLLSIPAALLFHEILLLCMAIGLDCMLTFWGLYIAQSEWKSFFKKPLRLWLAKSYFLLDFLSGNE